MTSPELSARWSLYQRLQSLERSQKFDSSSLGRDDALTAILDRFRTPHATSDPETFQLQFDYLCVNRTAKYRNRLRLDRRIAQGAPHVLATKHTDDVATSELVGLVRREASEGEWSILWMLAEAFTCREVADRFGMSVARLKSRVCRARSRIRNSPTGRRVRKVLGSS